MADATQQSAPTQPLPDPARPPLATIKHRTPPTPQAASPPSTGAPDVTPATKVATNIPNPSLAGQNNPVAAFARYEDDHFWYTGRRHIICALAQRLVPPSKDHLVLDVGCGPGANAAALAHDYKCVGIDTSAEAVELATSRFPDVTFKLGPAPESAGDVAGKADLVTVLDVLEHVPDDLGLLTAIVRAAKPGAHILITVPAAPDLWSPSDVSCGHLRRYTSETLQGLWAGLPVEIRLLSHYNSRLYLPVKMIRTLTSLLGLGFGDRAKASGTDLRTPPTVMNSILTRVFRGESHRLLAALDRGSQPYRRGVSLIAALKVQTPKNL